MLPNLACARGEFVKKLHASLAKEPYEDRGQVVSGQLSRSDPTPFCGCPDDTAACDEEKYEETLLGCRLALTRA